VRSKSMFKRSLPRATALLGATVLLATAGQALGSPAIASPSAPVVAGSAAPLPSMTAVWEAPATAALGSVVNASVRLSSASDLHQVSISVTPTGPIALGNYAGPSTLAAGSLATVAMPFTVTADGTGTIHVVVTGLDITGTPVQGAVDLDVATGAGRAVLSATGLLDAQDGALALQRGTLGEATYARLLNAQQGAGALQQVSVAAPAASSTTTVSGTVKYTASDGSKHPARTIIVQLRDDNGAPGGILVKAVTTDASGHFTATGTTKRSNGQVRQLFVRALSQGVGFEVKGMTATTPHMIASGDVTATGAAITINLTANNTADNNTAFDVADALTTAIAYTRRINGGNILQPVTANFPDVDGTNFDATTGTARILKLDRFDWDVILHEYGHFVSHQFDFNESPGGDHSFDQNEGETLGKDGGIKLAWSEGFATWFGLTAEDVLDVAALKIPHAGDSFYDDTEDASFHVAYETNTGLLGLGEDNELSIGRILWHLRKDPSIGLTDLQMIGTFHSQHPATLSAAIAELLPVAGAASFTDTQPIVAAKIAKSNAIGCVLTSQAVAPMTTAPAGGSTVTAAKSPAITWIPNGAGPSNRLDAFTVEYWSGNWDTELFQSPNQTGTAYTASANIWKTILKAKNKVGKLPSAMNIVVKGTGTNAPVTGPYKGCAVTVNVKR
jgi:hypothetical protein